MVFLLKQTLFGIIDRAMKTQQQEEEVGALHQDTVPVRNKHELEEWTLWMLWQHSKVYRVREYGFQQWV